LSRSRRWTPFIEANAAGTADVPVFAVGAVRGLGARVGRMTDESGPSGFLGRLRQRKWIVWLTVIGLLVLAGGVTFITIVVQAL